VGRGEERKLFGLEKKTTPVGEKTSLQNAFYIERRDHNILKSLVNEEKTSLTVHNIRRMESSRTGFNDLPHRNKRERKIYKGNPPSQYTTS